MSFKFPEFLAMSMFQWYPLNMSKPVKFFLIAWDIFTCCMVGTWFQRSPETTDASITRGTKDVGPRLPAVKQPRVGSTSRLTWNPMSQNGFGEDDCLVGQNIRNIGNKNFGPSMLVSWFASEPLWPSTLSPMVQGEICQQQNAIFDRKDWEFPADHLFNQSMCWQNPPFCRLNPRFFRVNTNLFICWTVIKHPRVHTWNQYLAFFESYFQLDFLGWNMSCWNT